MRVVNEMKSRMTLKKALGGKKSSAADGPLFTTYSPEEEKKEEAEDVAYSTLDDYSSAHSTGAAPLLNEIEANTAALLPTGAHMVSGPAQGKLLSALASQSREGRILEIGSFTGYATSCFLEGAAAAGECLGMERAGSLDDGGPFVLSLERDRRALGVASAHLKVMADFGIGAEGAAEASKLRGDASRGTFEVPF